ncbi:MAG TPA: polysaccharide deacetylase family protein [Nocardioides sp.]|nr:polysaccharide deacetylase family protein [Nocardioides sp.]
MEGAGGSRQRIWAVVLAVALSVAACQGSPEQAAPASPSPTPALSTTSAQVPTSTATAPPTTTTTTSSRPRPAPPPVTTTRPTAAPSSPATTPPPPVTTTATPTATCSIPSALRGRDLTSLGTTRKVVALTFDGGGGNEGVAAILRTLAAEGVPGSFFLTGQFVDAFPASATAIAARHPVGNHTYHHPDLTTLSSSAVRTEVRTAAARITTVTGQDPRPWFRFPFGAVDARTVSVVNAECYVPFRWTVDTLGWKGTSGGQSVATVVARVTASLVPGQIVLMHVGAHPTDRSTLDADALPRLIDALRDRGYSFVTLAAVIGPAP